MCWVQSLAVAMIGANKKLVGPNATLLVYNYRYTLRFLLHREYAHLANSLQATLQCLDVGLLLDLAVVVRVE